MLNKRLIYANKVFIYLQNTAHYLRVGKTVLESMS